MLEELEEAARLALVAGDGAAPLASEQVQELRDAFGAPWQHGEADSPVNAATKAQVDCARLQSGSTGCAAAPRIAP